MKKKESIMFNWKLSVLLISLTILLIDHAYCDVNLTINTEGQLEQNLLADPCFQKTITGWAAATGITINECIDGEIKIDGSQSGKWYYGIIKLLDPNLQPKTTYKLECSMRVVSISNLKNKPKLKLQTSGTQGKFVKNHFTGPYNTKSLDTWQKISMEFTTSENEKKGMVGIEKGTSKFMEIDFYLKDISFTKVARVVLDDDDDDDDKIAIEENTTTVSIGGMLEYHPIELNEPIFNIGCGITYPTWKSSKFSFEFIKPYTNIAYTRFTWNQLEPSPGIYNFDIIKSWINNWKEKGFERFAFGVMSTTVNSQATPLWLFDAGVPGVPHMDGKQIDPVYWNPLYLNNLHNFIKSMGDELKKYDNIEFIDMRNIGVWGEMHFGHNKKGMWTNEELIEAGYSGEAYLHAYQAMISFYKTSFPDTNLFLNIAPNQDTIIEFAAKEKINLRHDGLRLTDNGSMGSISTYFNRYGYPGNLTAQIEDISYNQKDLTNQVLNPSGTESLDGWSVANGMDINKTENEGVKISGIQDGKWNYAAIALADERLIAGEKYRLAGMIKVRSLAPEINAPYLKIQSSTDENKFVKNYNTNKYDPASMDKWQTLWVEFTPDETETHGYIAIEKGTLGSISTEIYAKNISLSNISDKINNDSLKSVASIANDGVHCCYEFASIEENFSEVKNIVNSVIDEPISYVNLNCLPENKILSIEEIDIIKGMAQKTGYHFSLDTIKCPAIIDLSEEDVNDLTFELLWKNTGSAPCYQHCLIDLVLADKNGKVISASQSEPHVPTWKWFPGALIKIGISIKIPADIEKGDYALKIRLIDSITLKSINLPLKNLEADKSYKILRLRVSDTKVLIMPG